jgi:hypothetical protein
MVELQKAIKLKYPQVTVLTYNGGRLSGIIEMLRTEYQGWDLIVGGYSWGADNTSIIAAKAGRPIKYLFALQPSVYYPTSPLWSNVKEALCVYNPYWFETGGLGFRELTLAPGNATTKLVLDAESDSHPYIQYDLNVRAKVMAGIGRALT